MGNPLQPFPPMQIPQQPMPGMSPFPGAAAGGFPQQANFTQAQPQPQQFAPQQAPQIQQHQAPAQGGGISLELDAFIQRGLISDVDVTFTNVRTGWFTYPGTQTVTAALLADLVTADGNKVEQVWSAGADVQPDATGRLFLPTDATKSPALANSSNVFELIQSLMNAGFPKGRLQSGDVKTLDGLQAHVIRKATDRAGLEPKKDKRGQDQKNTVMIVSAILKLPWETQGRAAAQARPNGVPAPAMPAAPAANGFAQSMPQQQVQAPAPGQPTDADFAAGQRMLQQLLTENQSWDQQALAVRIFQLCMSPDPAGQYNPQTVKTLISNPQFQQQAVGRTL